MRTFKYRTFYQWANKEKINDSSLKHAINEIEAGLFDAYLGSSLYKQRVAKKGRGKRSSYRIILAFKEKNRSFFMYGYAKNDRANISNKEEIIYKKLAAYYLEMSDGKIEDLIKIGELFEMK